MIFKKPLAGFALAVLASITAVPNMARAQGVDFLWGGGSEWGGGRQTVSFSTQYKPGQVIVSFGDRRLYLITQPGRAISYPIAVPREQSRWQGTTFVSDKRINPSWTPTPDMIAENPKLPRWVPGGHPMNPLGVRAMYLGSSTYRIHGTDAPWTIGQAVSKGCVRMYNEDVLDLYPRVPVGARVTVTWQRFSGKSVASSEAEAPVSTAQPKPVQVANTTANEPKYEYVSPFEFFFGDAPAPKKKTTTIKKYSSTAAKPKPADASEATPAATSAQPATTGTATPPAQTSTTPATTGEAPKPADATKSADATAAQKSAEAR